MTTIFSLIGPHAGESLDDILQRKIKDCECVGHTLWAYRSSHCTPGHFSLYRPNHVYFVCPTTKHGAKPTKQAFPIEVVRWSDGQQEIISSTLSPVTGSSRCSLLKIANLIVERQRSGAPERRRSGCVSSLSAAVQVLPCIALFDLIFYELPQKR